MILHLVELCFVAGFVAFPGAMAMLQLVLCIRICFRRLFIKQPVVRNASKGAILTSLNQASSKGLACYSQGASKRVIYLVVLCIVSSFWWLLVGVLGIPLLCFSH